MPQPKEPATPPVSAGEGETPPEQPAPEESYVGPVEAEREIEYEIVEPPPDEESEDGFERIPAGPTEEVRFDEEARRRPPRDRRRRERPRERREEPKRARIPAWAIIVALAVLAILLILVVLALLRQSHKAGPAGESPAVPRAVIAMSAEKEAHRAP